MDKLKLINRYNRTILYYYGIKMTEYAENWLEMIGILENIVKNHLQKFDKK